MPIYDKWYTRTVYTVDVNCLIKIVNLLFDSNDIMLYDKPPYNGLHQVHDNLPVQTNKNPMLQHYFPL